MQIPFYDPAKTYDENSASGPFGGFADDEILEFSGEPNFNFCGEKIFAPFGIPAGPLPNANFCAAAFRKNFCLPVYKTVRTGAQKCNGFPNIFPVDAGKNLSLERAAAGIFTKKNFDEKNLAITNSFGVPSLDPKIWQPDMQRAVKSARRGQILIASFQGTNRGDGEKKFIDDHILGAQLCAETGAKILEMNLSCPNEGKKKLLCHDTDLVEKISDKIKNKIGNLPLFLKISFFENDEILRDFISRLGKIVDGFSAINTIPAKIFNEKKLPALGVGREISGVCGAPIKWAGLEMTKKIAKIRADEKLNFKIIGVGGITNFTDFLEFKNAGADAAMSATGAMWNTNLGAEIAENWRKNFQN